MDLNGILNNFHLPEEAVSALSKQNLQTKTLGDGINTFSGHDGGTAFRFFTHTIHNPVKSRNAKYEVFDEIEMIEWYNDRFNKPTEMVKYLPPELLSFEREEIWGKDKNGNDKIEKVIIGEPIGGKYLEAYTRFKAGRSAPGTPLSKWGVLSDSLVASLAAKSVFSVEQFAAMPSGKIIGVFPKEVVEAWERAQQFVNSKEGRYEADKQAAEIEALTKSREEQDKKIAELSALVEKLSMSTDGKAKSKKKKEITEDIENLMSEE